MRAFRFRWTWLAVTAVLLTCGGHALTQETGSQQPAKKQASKKQAAKKAAKKQDAHGHAAALPQIQAHLNKNVTLEFVQSPLREVVEYLSELTGAEIAIDSRSLSDAGIAKNVAMTISVKELSLRSGLNLALGQVGLTWTIRDDVLTVTTPEGAEAALSPRVYAVSDLLQAGSAQVAGEYDYDSLIESMTSLIQPESWEEVGGPGAISGIFGSLVVSQTAAAHEQVAAFLEKYRAIKAAQKANPDKISDVSLLLRNQKRHRELAARLQKRTQADFVETPLDDVVEYLSDAGGVPIVIDRKSLKDLGIKSSAPVSLKSQAPVAKLLNRILRPLDLTWTIRDEVVLITTHEATEALLDVRLYPIFDLAGRSKDPEENGQQVDGLVEVITSTVEPDTWDDVGGPGGIEVLTQPFLLAVAQTQAAHEKIERLISALRTARTTAAPRPAGKPTYRLTAYQFAKVGAMNKLAPIDEKMAQQLTQSIQQLVEPASWTAVEAEITNIQGLIVVRQTEKVHRAIQRFANLIGLRTSPAGMPGFSGGMF